MRAPYPRGPTTAILAGCPRAPPAAPATRADGSFAIFYTPLPGATVEADATITCGSDTLHETDLRTALPGVFTLVVDDSFMTGACANDVRIAQTMSLADTGIDDIELTRTVHVQFDSQP